MAGYTFHLIPHTHWDREWYLPQSVFLARLVPALDDLLDRLTSEPGSTFLLDGQTVLLEDYLAARPDREATVVELARSGWTRGAALSSAAGWLRDRRGPTRRPRAAAPGVVSHPLHAGRARGDPP